MERKKRMQIINYISSAAIPTVILIIIMYGVIQKVKVYLGDEKQFLAVNAALPDTRANFFFVAVGFRCVDHAIAAADRRGHGVGAGFSAQHKRAEAHQRHPGAVIQSQIFHV